MIRLTYVNVPVPARDDCESCAGSGIAETIIFTLDKRSSVRDRVCACVIEWVRDRGELCCGGLAWKCDGDGLMFVCEVCQSTKEPVWDV